MKNIKKIAALLMVLALVLTAFAACSAKTDKLLIGSWRDTTGTLGYDFYEDGRVVLNYANFTIPIVNFTYDGDVNGTYTVEKADDGEYHLKLSYKIIADINEEFKIKIDNDILTLTNVKTNNTYTLTRFDPSANKTDSSTPSDSSNAGGSLGLEVGVSQ